MKRDLINLTDLNEKELLYIIDKSIEIKKNPSSVKNVMNQKTLLMIFEKPSLRTRVSFETAMTKMGGHAIYYDVKNSPLGVGETIADTAKCASRYVDIIMARLLKQSDTIELAKNSSVPVIDALSDVAHPCQIIADLMTIKEKKGFFKGLKLVYLGDADNNVTYSLMQGCAMTGINMFVISPQNESDLKKDILNNAKKIAEKNNCILKLSKDINDVKNADIVVTDTWMSYHIPQEQKEARVKMFMPYQVNSELMKKAKKDAIFMHCLPAKRGYEVTNEVIDSNQSVVFDEAENRMWTEMSIILFLLNKLN
ncbi:MAG: ornithine carbamoyltransferase [Candidatus Woesearchaeota archaeon]